MMTGMNIEKIINLGIWKYVYYIGIGLSVCIALLSSYGMINALIGNYGDNGKCGKQCSIYISLIVFVSLCLPPFISLFLKIRYIYRIIFVLFSIPILAISVFSFLTKLVF